MKRPVAAILTVGDELLRGDVIDSNKAHIAAVLGDHGFEVVQARTVLDRASSIVHAIRDLQTQVDCILVTGGLGPTVDDMTARAVAKAFELPIERFAEAEAHIKSIFARFNRPIAACNFQQADLPQGAELLANPNGTALGFALQWSGARSGHLMSLPGVPFEMREMLAHEVLPRLQKAFSPRAGASLRRIYRSMGMGESTLGERVGACLQGESWAQGIAQPFDGAVAAPVQHFRSHAPEVLLILEFPSLKRWPEGLLARLDASISQAIGESLYAIDAPELASQVAMALSERGQSIAVAESCTGGGLGELLTRQVGASRYFLGGFLTYSNAMKERLLGVLPSLLQAEGAVSGPCVQAMALGARERTGAHVGVAISGIAGPDGGRPDKPVGTVFVGVSTASGMRTAHLRLRGDRSGVRRRAAHWACRLVLDELVGRKTWLGSQGAELFAICESV